MEQWKQAEFENILFSIGNQIIKVSSDNSEKSDGLLNSENEYVLAIKADKVNISNGMAVETRIQYDKVSYFNYVLESLGVLTR